MMSKKPAAKLAFLWQFDLTLVLSEHLYAIIQLFDMSYHYVVC